MSQRAKLRDFSIANRWKKYAEKCVIIFFGKMSKKQKNYKKTENYPRIMTGN